MLVLSDVAEFIMSEDLIKLPSRLSDKESKLLVIGSIVIFDFLCN